MGRPRASREVARWRARAQAELGGPCIARNAYLALGHATAFLSIYSKFKLPLMTKLHRKQSTKSSFHRDLVAINVTLQFKTAVDHMGADVRGALCPAVLPLLPARTRPVLCARVPPSWSRPTVHATYALRRRKLGRTNPPSLLDAIPPSTLAPRSIHDLPTALQPRSPTAAPAHTALWTPNRLDRNGQHE